MTLNQTNSPEVEVISNIQKSSETTASMIKQISSTQVVSRHDNIIKSPNDKRSYRGLVLNNQMKILLISDPTTEKSAASLDVSVGYLNDPVEVPGIAHFCEHMLFLGTEKYPEENAYNLYLSQNGGCSNAATYMDHTNYYFDVSAEKLEGALDRFSQFFISPLFTESMTQRELNAVHSEHEKNRTNDTWRIDMLDKSSSDPNHVYSKFSTGDKQTLEYTPKAKNIDVRQELLNFHKQWYSANIMSLSVLGKEELDELEEIIVRLFSDVQNKDVKVPEWSEHPFKDEHFMKKWYIVPIKDVRNLNVTFPIPYLQKYYKAAPVHYLSHLLGHEGEGSLLSALKEKSWCNALVAGKRPAARGFDFFTVYVDLTEEGIKHTDDIIKLIFSYINMLKSEDPLKWIYEEYKDIADMNFRFREKISARSYVNATVQSLQEFPIDEVLSAPSLFAGWRPDLIEEVLKCLTPEKVRVQIVGKIFENIATEVEPWYQTKFKREDIPMEIIKKWKEAAIDPALRLPPKNEFIPSKFDIKLCNTTVDKYPVIIEDTLLMRVWFKQDAEFLVPKANLTFDFVSPLAYMDPCSTNMVYMFVQLFRDSLNEYAYAADLAGLKWELSNNKYGITLLIGGYDHKQLILLNKIMDRMVNFTVDSKRFEILKENYIRGLKNFQAEQPYHHAVYHLAVLLAEKVWGKEELLQACSELTVEKVQQFIPQLLSKMHVECLFHGNITKTEALNISKFFETKLTDSIPDITPLLPSQLVLLREIEIRNGCHFMYEVENKLHKNSCTQVYYQSGLQSTESNMLLELFAQIISEPCHNILRTQEQLGYIVFSGIRITNGTQGLRIIVQSDYHPQYVEQRIDHFMELMLEYVQNMVEEEFSTHKESLAKKKLDKPKMLSTLSADFWSEISTQQYNFDRANIEVAYLKTITKEQILQFFNEFINEKSPQRHKLSVHVISTAEGGAGHKVSEGEEIPSSNATKIIDILQFKNNQPLYPLPKPFISISRKGMQQQSKL